jgi:hypothetical protein
MEEAGAAEEEEVEEEAGTRFFTRGPRSQARRKESSKLKPFLVAGPTVRPVAACVFGIIPGRCKQCN